MRMPEKPLQRHEPAAAVETGTSWSGIFSPVLKFFGADGEKLEGDATGTAPPVPATGAGTAGATSSGSSGGGRSTPSTTVPALAGGASSGVRKPSPATTSKTVSSSGSGGGGRSTPTVTSSASTVSTSTSALAQRAAVSLTLSPSSPSSSDGKAAASPASSSVSVYSASGMTSPTAAVAPAAASAVVVPALAAAPADDEDDYEYEYEEFNPYFFIKMLPPYASVAPRVPRICLPGKRVTSPDINLILDLDETLVHCSVDPIHDADVQFPVAFNGTNYQVYVRKRPYLDKFLQWIAGRFEVTIFTASQQVYAERLLNLLDPEGKYINHRLYRDSCLNVDGNYLKDLNVLGRDLTKTVLVDNSPHAFGYQVDNGIPIESWFDDRADTELLKLMKFLDTLVGASDVRPFVRDKFKMHKLVAEARYGTPIPALPRP